MTTRATSPTLPSPPPLPVNPTMPKHRPPPLPPKRTQSAVQRRETALVTQRRVLCLAKALYSFPGERPGDLVFQVGDTVSVYKKTEGGWWKGFVVGAVHLRGAFPSSFVESIPDSGDDAREASEAREAQRDSEPVLSRPASRHTQTHGHTIINTNRGWAAPSSVPRIVRLTTEDFDGVAPSTLPPDPSMLDLDSDDDVGLFGGGDRGVAESRSTGGTLSRPRQSHVKSSSTSLTSADKTRRRPTGAVDDNPQPTPIAVTLLACEPRQRERSTATSIPASVGSPRSRNTLASPVSQNDTDRVTSDGESVISRLPSVSSTGLPRTLNMSPSHAMKRGGFKSWTSTLKRALPPMTDKAIKVVFEGFLKKRARANRFRWQTRYFQLVMAGEEPVLRYYKQKEHVALSYTGHGYFPCDKVSVQLRKRGKGSDRGCRFQLVVTEQNDKSMFELIAETPELCVRWTNLLASMGAKTHTVTVGEELAAQEEGEGKVEPEGELAYGVRERLAAQNSNGVLRALISEDYQQISVAIQLSPEEQLLGLFSAVCTLITNTKLFWFKAQRRELVGSLKARCYHSPVLAQALRCWHGCTPQELQIPELMDVDSDPLADGINAHCTAMQARAIAQGEGVTFDTPAALQLFHPFVASLGVVTSMTVTKVFNSNAKPLLLHVNCVPPASSGTVQRSGSSSKSSSKSYKSKSSKSSKSSQSHTSSSKSHTSLSPIPILRQFNTQALRPLSPPPPEGTISDEPVSPTSDPQDDDHLSSPSPSSRSSRLHPSHLSEPRESGWQPPPPVIFKAGDDMRQDLACLQAFRLMNYMWSKAKLEFQDQPVMAFVYGVQPVGPASGFIEFLPGCDSVRHIGRVAAHNEWLTTSGDHDELCTPAMARMLACAAGSFVASYILGVRDRHYDNILVRGDGLLFHIDFGHVLGGTVAVDAGAIAITPTLQEVMGGRWDKFVELCIEAFKVLRANSETLCEHVVLLFSCFEESDALEFLKGTLMLSEKVSSACKLLRKQIEQAPSSTQTRFKNALHRLATSGAQGTKGTMKGKNKGE